MLVSIVRQVVGFCSRYAWAVVAVATVITAVSGYYAATHFAITTDINKLIAPNLDWREREKAYEKEFPGSFGSILVVVDAPTPELATEASANLAKSSPSGPTCFIRCASSIAIRSLQKTACCFSRRPSSRA